MTDTTGSHAYTYDAANRLTSVDGVAYTWDDRGNLVGDGTFTYAYNGAGRLVRAESVTATLVYTYNTAGLRVAQIVDGTARPPLRGICPSLGVGFACQRRASLLLE